MRFLLFLLLACPILGATADELAICYNYGCAVQATVAFSEKQLLQLSALFNNSPNAKTERTSISKAIGLFETFSGAQTPTHNDRGGNVDDGEVDGRMDCIDHSHNATAYLRLMEKHGWLKFHRVLEPIKRAPLLVNDHWAAHIQESHTAQEFIVDSWFFDNGQPAVIFTLDDWMSGAVPDERTPRS